MNEKLEKAIANVLGLIQANQMKSDDALKFSQAALNLANAQAVLTQLGSKSKGSG